MRKVVLSALSLQPGRIGGVEFMIRNLALGLSGLPRVQPIVAAARPATSGWPSPIQLRHAPAGGNRFLLEGVWLPALMLQEQADVLIMPNYFTPPLTFAARTVTVIHDLLYRVFPRTCTRTKRAWLRMCHRVTVERADVVVATSQHAANALESVYGSMIGRKLRVIPIPIDWTRFGAGNEQAAAVRSPYFISVAAEWPHKNLATLLRAFAGVRRDLPDYQLVLVGQTHQLLRGHTVHDGPSTADLVDALSLRESVRVTGHIDDAELGRLYGGATALVFPSLFEGFGMPPVEALGLALPVITTSCGAIPETTRSLATYVRDPLDAKELGEALVSVARAPASYRPNAAQVQALRAHYSPTRIAAEYVALM